MDFKTLLIWSADATKAVVFSILNLGFCCTLLGQSNNNYKLPTVLPTSPDAASLGQYVQAPVNFYNGVPQIDIPLYTISYKNLNVPIAISYNASGIKVQDKASSIGTGWALSFGGTITRIARGGLDELPTGYKSGQKNVEKILNNQLSANDRADLIKRITRGEVDAEPDIFLVNLPGFSCKFFFDENGGIYTVPKSKVKITPGTVGGLGFQNWTVTTTDGTVFELGASDGSELSGGLEKIHNNNNCAALADDSYNNWYLTKITPVVGAPITFEYESYTSTYFAPASMTNYRLLGVILAPGSSGAACQTYEDWCTLTTTMYSKKIKKIIFNNGEVLFTHGDSRLDLGGDKTISQIVVHNKQGATVKKWIFYQSYRNNSPSPAGQDGKRLFLDSLRLFDAQICDDAGCVPNPQLYKFEYNNELLPPRNTWAQDFWGYYNGATSNSTLVPKMVISNPYASGYIELDGADRIPNEQFTKAGVLEKVVYPTGGHLQLTYELNDAQTGVPYFKKSQQNLQYSYPTVPSPDHGGVFVVSSCNDKPIKVHAIATGVADPSGDPSNKQQWRIYKLNVEEWEQVEGAALGSLTLPDTDDRTFFFGSGTYKVQIYDPTNANVSATVAIDWKNDVDCFIRPVGGLRVKETKFRDGIKEEDILITQYDYKSFTDPTKSSGGVANFPEYHYTYLEDNVSGYIDDDPIIDKCKWFVYNSVGTQPLSTTGIGNVGYSNITVSKIHNGEKLGKTEYTFESPLTVPDNLPNGFPFASIDDFDWKRGQVIKIAHYKSNGETFAIVEEESELPQTISQENVPGLKTGVNDRILSVISNLGNPELVDVSVPVEQVFYTGTGFSYSSQSTNKTYDQVNPSLAVSVVENRIVNTNNYQLASSSSVNSKGEVITTHLKYTADYEIASPSGNFATSIKALQNKNILDLPVEKYITKKVGTNEHVVSGQLFEYNAAGQPIAVYQLNIAQPLAIGSFTPSSVINGAIAFNSNYKPEAFLAYDGSGNIIQLQKANDFLTKLIWDYNNELPAAECINCDGAIAFTSFETNSYGGWTVSSNNKSVGGVTGTDYYELASGSIQSPTLSASNLYTVSYWTNGASFAITGSTSTFQGREVTINGVVWKYFEHTISNSTGFTIAGSGKIDELRLYPKHGQLTTFTHQPLVGITAKCDLNSIISYFEYDAFGRLKLIRDHDRSILKHHEYKFQQPVQ